MHFDWLKVGKVGAPVLLTNILFIWFLVFDGCNEEGKCGQNYSSHIMSHILGRTLIGIRDAALSKKMGGPVVIVKGAGTGLQADHLDFLLVYFQKYGPNPAAL